MVEEERYMETDPADAEAQQARRGGVKLDRSKSQFAQKARSKEDFEQRADAVHSQMVDKNEKAAKLSKDFWDMVRGKILVRNKGPIDKSMEKEVITNLISYARDLNNPPFNENDTNPSEEGLGSISIIALLMKTAIHQRDLYNELEFRLSAAEKKIKLLSSESPMVDKDGK